MLNPIREGIAVVAVMNAFVVPIAQKVITANAAKSKDIGRCAERTHAIRCSIMNFVMSSSWDCGRRGVGKGSLSVRFFSNRNSLFTLAHRGELNRCGPATQSRS